MIITESVKQNMQSLKMVEPKPWNQRVFFVISIIIITLISCCILIPWQQSVYGVGKITVYNPEERPQVIASAITGKIKKWWVKDGQTIKKGDLLLELIDIDPKFLDPNQVATLEKQQQALLMRKEALIKRIGILSSQSGNLERSRKAAIPSAALKTKQANYRLYAAQQSVAVAKQNVQTTQLQLDRLKQLYEMGLRSKRDWELSQLEQVKAETELQRAEASYNAAQNDVGVFNLDQAKVATDLQAGVQSVNASLADAEASLASIETDLAKVSLEQNILNQRVAFREIRAPIDGKIVSLAAVGQGQTIDQGANLVYIAPFTQDLVAELYVTDNDVTLLKKGSRVRLQFSGWPALQFSGWPSISVGTFAGKVSVIDAVDDGLNRFRVIVKPDTEAILAKKEEAWPSAELLRPGTEATGWILLNTVPLWYEMWRQFNAFPPSVSKPELNKMLAPNNDGGKGNVPKTKK